MWGELQDVLELSQQLLRSGRLALLPAAPKSQALKQGSLPSLSHPDLSDLTMIIYFFPTEFTTAGGQWANGDSWLLKRGPSHFVIGKMETQPETRQSNFLL